MQTRIDIQQTSLLYLLPVEVLLQILCYLDQPAVAQVSVGLHSLFNDNTVQHSFWRQRFKRHFPDLYHETKIKKDIRWKDEFTAAEKVAYEKLSPRARKLFYLVKDDDVEGVRACNVTFDEFVNLKDSHDRLLRQCINKRNTAMFDLFLLNCDVDTQDCNESTTLRFAALYGLEETVRTLLSRGAKVNKASVHRSSPLLCAALGGYVGIVELLLEAGADVNWKNNVGDTALHMAAKRGFLQIVIRLIEKSKNIHINIVNDREETPLAVAFENEHFEISGYLLKSHADVNQRLEKGKTRLFNACFEGNQNAVTCLLTNGANVNLAHDNGASPLFAAAQNGFIDIVIALLMHDEIDCNASFLTNEGSLVEFAARRSEEIQQRMRYFLQTQEDLNNIRMRAIDIARVMGHDMIVDLIAEKSERYEHPIKMQR